MIQEHSEELLHISFGRPIKGYERFLNVIEGTSYSDYKKKADGSLKEVVWYSIKKPKEYSENRLKKLKGE
ncbi:hypothetical protein WH50_14560 [Pokkaliibacter plantistimulans]|uniref:Uncharacterized protein n=1 Tax=Pokkaliibacter plantistimulans TaxID=1635171 RepID=A0ABX5LV67_9GAMM|nr:hypothetical protein WH50_14560 [Pokkaliibacter plantistimulans]